MESTIVAIFEKKHWPGVRQAQWRGSRLILFLKKGNLLGRRLDFYLNPFTSAIAYSKHRASVETFLPPVLERIHALAGDDLKISSAPPSSRWLLRLTFG
jgi:hypothetical protein